MPDEIYSIYIRHSRKSIVNSAQSNNKNFLSYIRKQVHKYKIKVSIKTLESMRKDKSKTTLKTF